MKLGEKIGDYLTQHGIRKSFVAEKTGIPLYTINDMCNGKRKVGALEYFSICKAISVPVTTFINDEETDLEEVSE